MTATTDFADIAKMAAAQLPLAAHQVAVRLADAHGHLWATEEGQRLLASASDAATLEAALNEIQAECERLNSPESGSGPLGLELRHALRVFQAGEGLSPCYTHTTISGRLAWNIVPSAEGGWFMTLSICRPAVEVAGRQYPEGIALEARYSSLEGWTVVWGMGAPYYSRHVETLADAITATGLVDGPLDSLPVTTATVQNRRPTQGPIAGPDGWPVVREAAAHHERQTARLLVADLKARFGAEPLRALAAMAAELGTLGAASRALRDAT